jgi:hypothetical protein
MMTNFPPPIEVGGGPRSRILKKFAITFGVGLFCALSTTAINLLVFGYISKGVSPSNVNMGSIFESNNSAIVKYSLFIIVGPFLETLIFVGIWVIPNKNTHNKLMNSIFVSIMTSLSWLLHGANWMAVSRAFGFFNLSLLFVHYARKESVKSAFWATAAAHCFWNMNGLILISFIGLFRQNASWVIG